MKTKVIILACFLVAALGFMSCTNLEPEMNPQHNLTGGGYVNTSIEHIYTAQELFPDGVAQEFVIYPMDGWTIRKNEVIIFKALLLDPVSGEYRDVTNDKDCQFDYSWMGKMAHGDDPSLRNGQEITISAVWKNTIHGSSTGHFIN